MVIYFHNYSSISLEIVALQQMSEKEMDISRTVEVSVEKVSELVPWLHQ